MPGLDETIREVVRAYRQGPDAPASAVERDMQVVLPVPAWSEAAFIEVTTANLTAGQVADQTVLQIPGNERAWLDGIVAFRATGDNLVHRILVEYPPGYGSGNRTLRLLEIVAVTDIWWPDSGTGNQVIVLGVMTGSLLIEPLTNIQLSFDGTGVAASTFTVQIIRRRMKLTRAQAP